MMVATISSRLLSSFLAILAGAFGDEREPAAVDFRDETQIIVGRWRALDVFGIRFHGRV